MSIIANKIKREGNSIFIKSTPQSGIIALTSFVDNASGEAGPINFTKSFRYSHNGIIFSDWIPLTPLAITSLSIAQKDTIVFEIQYLKNQPDGVDALNVTEATIGTTDNPIESGDYFKNTVFNQFFKSEDPAVLNWMINVVEKLFNRGILPSYIDRFNDFGSPDDFINFWKSICKFFSYYVVYARKFQKFYESEVLLSEYLEQRGISTSPLNTIDQLQLLMEYFYHQISNRGTNHIVDHSLDGEIDGELLRLIHHNIYDEFIFNLNKSEHFGWNIGNSSPLYRGAGIYSNANKFYEKGEISDISKYPISGGVVIEEDVSINNKKVLKLTNGGIVNDNLIPKFNVDPSMDYELFFLLKKNAGDDLTIGIDAFDKDGAPINLLSRKDGSQTNNFITNKDIFRHDKYVGIRLFIYNKNKPLFSSDASLLRDGCNLKFVEDVAFIAPRINISGTGWITDIRFTPMYTPYSKGIINMDNFIDCWAKNNNKEFSYIGLRNFVKKYLIPYNAEISFINPDTSGDYSLESPISEGAELNLAEVITSIPSNLYRDKGIVGGTIINNGGSDVTERGIVWSINPNPTLSDNKLANGIGSGVFSRYESGFQLGTTIYLKAYAINASGVSYGQQEQFDTSEFVLDLYVDSANPSNAISINWQIVFSGDITGLTASNFQLVASGITGASISSVVLNGGSSGDIYNITVNTGSGSGSLGLNFVNNTGLNKAVNAPFVGQVYIIDKDLPNTDILTHPSALTSSANANFTFVGTDPAGTGIESYDVRIDGGSWINTTDSFYNFTGLSNGPHTFQVRSKDVAGNYDATPATYSWNIDATPLVVSSINRQNPIAQNTTVDEVTFRVTFNKPAFGVQLIDFSTVFTGTLTGNKVSIAEISTSVYDITVGGLTGAGSVRLDLNSSGTLIVDSLGTPVAGGFTTGQTYNISTVVLNEFDYLVVRFTWAFGAGRDLDIVTGFIQNGVPAIDATLDSSTSYLNKWVGYGNNTGLPVGNPLSDSYAFWALDNVNESGVEAVLVSFNKVITDHGGSIVGDIIKYNLRGVFFGVLGTGEISVSLQTYLGGTMSKVGTDIINTGGVLVDDITIPGYVTANNQAHNYPNSTQLGVIRYNKVTKIATLSPT